MTTVAGLISFKAKAGQGAEVARLISAALPHVKQEAGTQTWLVLRSNAAPDSVFLVDLFSDAASREAHMNGEAAKLIFATVPALLDAPPMLHPANLVAHKGA